MGKRKRARNDPDTTSKTNYLTIIPIHIPTLPYLFFKYYVFQTCRREEVGSSQRTRATVIAESSAARGGAGEGECSVPGARPKGAGSTDEPKGKHGPQE